MTTETLNQKDGEVVNGQEQKETVGVDHWRQRLCADNVVWQ
jgi:hypothetical protein